MKEVLRPDQGFPAKVLWTLAIIGGVSVANLYYNQPLLGLIRADLHISEFQANLIAMVTQAGYALGLFFIVPMGDLFKRKKIVLTNFFLLILSLILIGLSQNIWVLLMASLVTGVCSIVPQIFVPIAAQYSTPKNKGRNVGIIISGLLTGILASRVFSGFIGAYFGWRYVFFIATIFMLISTIVVVYMLPETNPTFKGNYKGLMRSILSLIVKYPSLLLYSSRAGLAFGAFLMMWSTLAFKMQLAPFHAGSNIVGMLGLCGITGALAASFVGKYIQQVGVPTFNVIGCCLILSAWGLFFFVENSYVGIISGIILIDVGMQCIQLSNQTSVFEVCPDATSRINTIFMTIYFIGGSLGTLLAGFAWRFAEWHGVVFVGVCLTVASLSITIIEKSVFHYRSA
ncbi:MAG: MFS transporter [Bacteroidaceae bacterium]